MTPPTHALPSKRQEAGIGEPTLGTTIGYAIGLLAIVLAFSYPVVAGAVLLALASTALSWAIYTTLTR